MLQNCYKLVKCFENVKSRNNFVTFIKFGSGFDNVKFGDQVRHYLIKRGISPGDRQGEISQPRAGLAHAYGSWSWSWKLLMAAGSWSWSIIVCIRENGFTIK